MPFKLIEESKGWSIEDYDIDYATLTKTIRGRLTKNRYKVIDRFCREKTKRFNCGCIFDCCGCLCSRRISIRTVTKEEVILEMTESRNY